MFNMLNVLWASLATLFGAFGKASSALDALAGWADESAQALADEARITRAQKKSDLEAALRKTELANSTKAKS